MWPYPVMRGERKRERSDGRGRGKRGETGDGSERDSGVEEKEEDREWKMGVKGTVE